MSEDLITQVIHFITDEWNKMRKNKKEQDPLLRELIVDLIKRIDAGDFEAPLMPRYSYLDGSNSEEIFSLDIGSSHPLAGAKVSHEVGFEYGRYTFTHDLFDDKKYTLDYNLIEKLFWALMHNEERYIEKINRTERDKATEYLKSQGKRV